MHCRFSYLLLFLTFFIPCSAFSQEPPPDTTFLEEMAPSAADEQSYVQEATEEEAVDPEVPVSYNKAQPGQQQWQSVVSDKAYSYKNKVEYVVRKEKPPRSSPLLLLLFLRLYAFFVSLAGRILLIGLLILIVGYILYRILSGEGKNLFSKDKAVVHGDDGPITEEDLFTRNWEQALQDALRDKAYRQAIRYSYLMLLQLLQARGNITYRPDKTNTDYYRELADAGYRQDFRHLSRQYETAWYGDYATGEEAFNAYMALFNGLKNKLGAS